MAFRQEWKCANLADSRFFFRSQGEGKYLFFFLFRFFFFFFLFSHSLLCELEGSGFGVLVESFERISCGSPTSFYYTANCWLWRYDGYHLFSFFDL